MAEKRVSQIAKEHGITALELLEQLRDNGLVLPNAKEVVEEDDVVRLLGLNGGPAVEQPVAPTPEPEPVAEPVAEVAVAEPVAEPTPTPAAKRAAKAPALSAT